MHITDTKLDLIIGAQIGHDGFDAPGGGSYYHQLHHAHFECNYGDAAFPMDWLFGTFEDGSRWANKQASVTEREAKKTATTDEPYPMSETDRPRERPMVPSGADGLKKRS